MNNKKQQTLLRKAILPFLFLILIGQFCLTNTVKADDVWIDNNGDPYQVDYNVLWDIHPDWNLERTMEAAAHRAVGGDGSNGIPSYQVERVEIFTSFTPSPEEFGNDAVVVIHSDDGATIEITCPDGEVRTVLNRENKGQTFDNLKQSFHVLNYSFEQGKTYEFRIQYQNKHFNESRNDIDRIALCVFKCDIDLYAYNDGGAVELSCLNVVPIPLNYDDDDNDGIRTKEYLVTPDSHDTLIQSATVTKDDDLLMFKLHKYRGADTTGKHFQLEFDSKYIRLWKKANKTGKIDKTTKFSVTQYHKFYAEGIVSTEKIDHASLTVRLYKNNILTKCKTTRDIQVAEPMFAIFGHGKGANEVANFNAEIKKIAIEELRYGKTLIVKGKLKKKKKGYYDRHYFSIQVVESEKPAIIALQTEGAYIAYSGHSNFGIGFSFKTGHTRIADFLNCGRKTVPLNWLYMKYAQGHPNLTITKGGGGPGKNEYAGNPARNYRYFDRRRRRYSYLIEPDAANKVWLDHHKHHNPMFKYVPYNQAVHKNKHDWVSVAPTGTTARLYIIAGHKDMGKRKWKKVLLSSCDSGGYYGWSFTYGTFFYTKYSSYADDEVVGIYIKAIIAGKTDKEILNLIEAASTTFKRTFPGKTLYGIKQKK